MKLLKNGTALLVCLVMMLTVAPVAPQSQAAGETATITTTVKEINKFSNLVLDTTVVDFNAAGFDYGDIMTVSIGSISMDMPVCDNFMEVDAYKNMCMILKDDPNNPYVVLGTNCGSFALDLPVKTEAGTKVTLTMKEKGGYLERYNECKLVRTNERSDYPNLSDEEYANFRVVSTTGMGEGVLYRSSSPVDPELNRNTYAMAAIEKYGIKTILNANDSDEAMKAYPGYSGSYYASCNVDPLGMMLEFRSSSFEKKLADGIRYMANNPGPYLSHCVEGKDRTGFTTAVLEAFMGASADEILDDYMTTYYNYYGVKPGEKSYDFIRDANLPITLRISFGVSDIHTADLATAAETYLKRIGLTADELTKLRQNLGAPVITDNSKLISLKANKTYKKYDVTCDGKTDTVRVKFKKRKSGKYTMQICINGKAVYKKSEYYLEPSVKILHFDKKNQLVSAGYGCEDDMSFVKLFSYKNKNWKLVRDLNNVGLASKYSFGGKPFITGITANSVTVENRYQMPMIGADTFEYTYLYNGAKMTLKKEDAVIKICHYNGPDYQTNGYESDATLESRRTLKVYADASTSSGKVAEIHKDDSVVFHLMRVVSKRPWFYVTVGNVAGWLPAGGPKSDNSDSGDEGSGYYFKWLMFYS